MLAIEGRDENVAKLDRGALDLKGYAAGQYLRDFRTSIAAFIKGITTQALAAGGKHTIAIVTLSSRPTVNTNYTSDQAVLLKGADRVFPQQATHETLLDGIRETSDALSRFGKDYRRPRTVRAMAVVFRFASGIGPGR